MPEHNDHNCRRKVQTQNQSPENAFWETNDKVQLEYSCPSCSNRVYFICEPYNVQLKLPDENTIAEPVPDTEPANLTEAPLMKRHQPNSDIGINDLSDVLHTWLSCSVEDLQYELPSGKIATSMTVQKDAIIFKASETFGEGFTPYADSPETHLEYLESDDVARTEGTVRYQDGGETLTLPSTIYFEERIDFDRPITSTDPEKIAIELENRLTQIDGINSPVEVNPPTPVV